MPVPCCVPRILVHGASTENEESMDSCLGMNTRHSLGTNTGHTLNREESVDSDLGRQGLAREDTIESLLSSPDLDSYCWLLILEDWRHVEVASENSLSLSLFGAKLPTDWIQTIWLEEPWLSKDDNIRLFPIMCITWNFECQNILTILTRLVWYMHSCFNISAADPTQVRWLSSHLLTEDHGTNIMELSVYVQTYS